MNPKKQRRSAIVALILIVLFIITLPTLLRERFPLHHAELIAKYSALYNLDSALVAAVIQVESGFRPKAISKKGAMGLMQLMPETAAWLGEQKGQALEGQDLLEPDVNISLGTFYLKYLLDRFPTEHAAIAAYNGGPTNARRWLDEGIWDGSYERSGQIPFGETKHYVRKVGTMRRLYQFLYK